MGIIRWPKHQKSDKKHESPQWSTTTKIMVGVVQVGPTTKSIVGPPDYSLSGLQTPEVVESGGANSCPQTRRLRTKPSTGRASVVGVEEVVVF